MKTRMKGFTLIELIAVLVIMAIIALIVTPLVMSIIRKARVSADKRSIDAYGRSIEFAIAGYLLDTGNFPTEISQLTIEYSGNEVVCSTTQINSDSSVYLAGCTVAGRSVEGYTYGKEETITYTAYEVGDHVSYNGITYYVIEESGTTNDTIKLLKEVPLTYAEMDALALEDVDIGSSNSYGAVDYGKTTDYATSTVKKVVDAWKNSAVKLGDTAIVRLITPDELSNLGFEYTEEPCQYCSPGWIRTDDAPNWTYLNYGYWTMVSTEQYIWLVTQYDISIASNNLSYYVRPVLELNKSADITKLAS